MCVFCLQLERNKRTFQLRLFIEQKQNKTIFLVSVLSTNKRIEEKKHLLLQSKTNNLALIPIQGICAHKKAITMILIFLVSLTMMIYSNTLSTRMRLLETHFFVFHTLRTRILEVPRNNRRAKRFLQPNRLLTSMF